MNTQPEPDRIAEEAVGQKHDSVPPEGMERHVTPDPRSAGAHASVSEKTAESVGERVGDAYSDPGSAARTWKANSGRQGAAANPILAAGRQLAETVSRQFDQQPLIVMGACFAFGYMTALLLHGRNADFGSARGSSHIRHPRVFLESAVLKTIAEHPQGLTTTEIVQELGVQGIGQQSVATALGALVQAKKVSRQGREGKYVSAAPEVPSAPDQPSS